MSKLLQRYKKIHYNFDTEYTNDKEWFITRPGNYRCCIKEPEMNKTLLFIIGLEPDEISPAGMKYKYMSKGKLELFLTGING